MKDYSYERFQSDVLVQSLELLAMQSKELAWL